MRTILKDTLGKTLPDHVGLAYDRYAPLEDGKIPDNKRDAWLRDIASIALPVDYKFAYERWKNTWTTGHRNARAVIVRLASRLLVGHGHSSPTEVGLTLHPTWGVPMIPGSALKGLLNHYIDAVYGPGDIHRIPPTNRSPNISESGRGIGALSGIHEVECHCMARENFTAPCLAHPLRSPIRSTRVHLVKRSVKWFFTMHCMFREALRTTGLSLWTC